MSNYSLNVALWLHLLSCPLQFFVEGFVSWYDADISDGRQAWLTESFLTNRYAASEFCLRTDCYMLACHLNLVNFILYRDFESRIVSVTQPALTHEGRKETHEQMLGVGRCVYMCVCKNVLAVCPCVMTCFVNTFAYAALLVFAARVILHSHLHVETLFYFFSRSL